MLAMTAGFLTILLWPSLPEYWVALVCCGLAILLFKTHRTSASFIAGLSLCIVSTNFHFADLKLLLTANSSIKGEIVSLPVQGKHHNRFYFELSQIEIGDLAVASDARVAVIWPGQHKLEQGQKLELKVKAKPISGLFNQGSFNYQRYMISNGVIANASVYEGKILNREGNFRARTSALFESKHGYYSEMRFIRALVIGDKAHFGSDDWQVLQRTGTSHLFAISGLHLGLVCFLTLLIIKPIVRLLNLKARLALTCSLVVTLAIGMFYSGLAGFSYPTIRALVMLAIGSVFVALGQRIDLFRVVLITLWIIGLFDPLGLLAQGLWLSIFALLCVVVSARWLSSSRLASQATWRAVIMHWFVQLLKIQLGLALGLSAVQLLFFGGISVIAPIANLVAVPMISMIVLPSSVMATLFEFLGFEMLAHWLFTLANFTVSSLYSFLEWLSNLTLSWQSTAVARIIVIGALLIVLLIVLDRLRLSSRGYFGVIAVLFTVAKTMSNKTDDDEQWKIDFLDVGHGNSAVIVKNNRAIVVDTGNVLGEHSTMAKGVILPFIAADGIREVDYIFITHMDADHSAGLADLKQHFARAITVTNQQGQCSEHQIDWQGLQIRFTQAIGLKKKSHRNENNESCLIHISGSYGNVLFTGDIERPAEKLLVQQLDESWAADVMQVPHHGSKTSSSRDLVELIQPKFAVVSTASFNQWHFPSLNVVNRYQRNGVQLLNTATMGQITIKMSASGPNITNYRGDPVPFWYNGDLSFGHYQR
ncbi:MAG: DNA internalization-related competence protein ComEC/Rec2 [Psychrobium sp.]